MYKTIYERMKWCLFLLVFLSGIATFPTAVGQTTSDYDYGDAPEGYVAYPGTPLPGVIGWFPTCIYVGVPGSYIRHATATGVGGGYFGMFKDYETDGNAGNCPSAPPNTTPPNMDECFGDMDAGLIKPGAYNITESGGIGVVSTCPLSPGGKLGVICGTATWGTDIDINVTGFSPPPGNPFPAMGYLNVLADWNQDGEWTTFMPCSGTTQINERVLKNVQVPNNFSGRASLLSLLTQSSFQIGPNRGYVWFRFTITDVALPEYWTGDGSYANGETEDYLLYVSGTDFGDAPSPYPTTLAGGGARHYIGKFKMSVDPLVWPDHETDGQPDLMAEGDDVNGIDDEDGVLLPSSVTPGQTVSINVVVSGELGGNPVSGKLNAWIDWNKNGVWESANNEYIINNQTVIDGVNSFSITVPLGATTGYTFARFRLSTETLTTPGGPAADGEVEDYRILVQVPETFDFGDAPEGAPAYPDLGVMGQFPTCMNAEPAGFVKTTLGGAFFGPSEDSEMDGNGGVCPNFTPGLYNMDECVNDNDAGLTIAGAYTITGATGSEIIIPCMGSSAQPLGSVCTPAIWGQNLDMYIQNPSQTTAYVNVLIDWNRDGSWEGGAQCYNGPMVPEHVLVNHPVAPGYNGLLSGTGMLQPIFIGPIKGYVWARFTISSTQVTEDWNGSGEWGYGETEDYLLKVIPAVNLNLNNITIPTGNSHCFEALQTITLAGDGTTVIVEDGASAAFIAGQNILMKEGTHFQNGSSVNAYIDITGQFCPTLLKSATATVTDVTLPKEAQFFRVYPNPTPGQFTLELNDADNEGNIRVEVFNLMGDGVIRTDLPLKKQYTFDLAGRESGLYLIKVMKDRKVGFVKLIKL
ncbi:MAG TPA: GEVED domain-containing protein [Bacteroidales bacterium]|nr:GEVED domain-containing protein [Bacteroidales bacterium]HPS61588.1 GEVED domain-containing protein [Bacteroidales bacterium]